MSIRNEGWYWCKHTSEHPWECCHWHRDQWVGRGMYHEPYSVGPRIPTPDEPWACVPKYEPTDFMLFKAETEAKHKEVDMYSPTPTEHPDDGGGITGCYYRGLIAGAPKP